MSIRVIQIGEGVGDIPGVQGEGMRLKLCDLDSGLTQELRPKD